MNNDSFLKFVIAQNNATLSETNAIFDRSSKTVSIIALLAGVTVYLSSFKYLGEFTIVAGIYYLCMALNSVFLSAASLSLAFAFKNRKYDVINVSKWHEWRIEYANLFSEDMEVSPDEIERIIEKELSMAMTAELCKYTAGNKSVNDGRRWYVDVAISLAAISSILIIGEALCRLVLEQF